MSEHHPEGRSKAVTIVADMKARSEGQVVLPPARRGIVKTTSAEEARAIASGLGQAMREAVQVGDMDDISAELDVTQDGDRASLRMRFRAYRRSKG